MATETQTKAGSCPTHGVVDATREVPRVQFPFIITSIQRAMAKRRAYRCPECGADVETD
jgi:hypothetical protein